MEKREWSDAEWKNRAARYCTLAEHCPQEVLLKLRQWETPKEWWDSIIDYLYDENYINDRRFCQSYVHDKVAYQAWGRIKIKAMLRGLKLPSKEIEEALKNIDETTYFAQLNHLKESRRNDPQERRIRFLLQRGFTMEEALGE